MEIKMKNRFFTFGEILWDCLPSGRHSGGAPFNVAADFAQLGVSASLISAIGQDALGDELLQVAKDKHIDTRFISRARIDLPTGTVEAKLNAHGDASYEIARPVAWDEIPVSSALEPVAQSDALVFGSLSGRSLYNRDQLHQLLALKGPVKYLDVNLRSPFFERTHVLELARLADVIKLNHEELAQLASWVGSSGEVNRSAMDLATIEKDCVALANATKTTRICITRAEAGASFWDNGEFVSVPAPAVTVKDTVGAGDAFMAALVLGLTREIEAKIVLRVACQVGGFVASYFGATPLFSAEIVQQVEETLRK
jgi:fructokinase